MEQKKRVLVVDDEPNVRNSLRLLLTSHFDVVTAESGLEAIERLQEARPDVILLDVLMPQLDGLETLERIKTIDAAVPVVMLTGSNTVKTAVQAMKYGAFDYLNKPFDVDELTSLIITALDCGSPIVEERIEGSIKHTAAAPAADFGPMIGAAPVMLELFERVRQVAERDTTALITGESGTGKELVAHQLHALSARRDRPFVALNCGAIPETLIESELFGHEKGAFTSAIERRIGHCELADGGTLFLDEIGELSLPVQVKMLRFLQEQEFFRVGRSTPVKVNVRIIAATNKNLEELTREKKFREDLFYRVHVISLDVPPLRDRFEDIPALVDYFVKKCKPHYGERELSFNEEAMRYLIEYEWPGNVRELENVVESLMALSPVDTVTAEILPPKIKTRPVRASLRLDVLDGGLDFEEAERRFETDIIVKALRKTNYVQTRAAELLGISRRILKYKMDKLGIADRIEGGGDDEGVNA